jgi:hypothetical protein
MGTAVVSGMLAATMLGIFLIPSLFVLVERLAGGKELAPRLTAAEPVAVDPDKKDVGGSHR